MKDDTFTRSMAALPAHSALAGIRAYILKEGMEGNLDAATAAFHQLWNCEGNEGTRAELAEFLVARYAYRGQLDTARNIYGSLSLWERGKLFFRRGRQRFTSSPACLWRSDCMRPSPSGWSISNSPFVRISKNLLPRRGMRCWFAQALGSFLMPEALSTFIR